MDVYHLARMERIIGGPVPEKTKSLFNKIHKRVQAAHGPSYADMYFLSLIAELTDAFDEPEAEFNRLTRYDTGKKVVFRLGNGNAEGTFVGLGPGGRYRVDLGKAGTKHVEHDQLVEVV